MMSTFGQKLLVVLAFTVSMTSAGLPEDEIGLDTNDFANGEKIDLENEIPPGEDPLNDAMSGNGFEGDIDLTPEEKKALENGNEGEPIEMRQAVVNKRWPRVGDYIQVPYTINHNEFEPHERANIARAIEEFEKHTCIR